MMSRSKTGRGLVSVALSLVLLVTGCSRYAAIQTNPSSPLTGGDVEPGDHVRVGLADGRTVEGRLEYLGQGRYQVGPTEISEASVVSISRRENRLGTTAVLIVAVGFVVLAAAYASAANDWY